MKKTIFITILFVIILISWSRYISTSGIVVKEYGVKTSIPASYHGLKIVHFSDVHFGRTINKNRLENIVQEINLLRPDLVFFTGDLIDKDVAATENTKEYLSTVLKKISTTYGKYAVTGNHDYYYDYKTIMEKSDFIVLNNENDVIYNQNQDPIFIGGLESESGGNMNVNAMAAPLKEGTYQGYKIVIMHTPDSFDKIKKYELDLVLAGHSHNGQVRFPFIGKVITPPYAKIYYENYYQINKTSFYISSGLGTSTLNFRLFNKPSINFYRLLKKD